MKGTDLQDAKNTFEYWINNYRFSEHEFAIAASSIGYLNTLLGNNDQATDWLIKAAMADIKSSTKETVALRNLSDLIYKKGDVVTAYRYINLALEDATFYNARHRKIEIAKILPIIEGEKLHAVEKQKTVLEIYAALITLLIIVVLIFAYVIFKQLGKLKQAKSIIQEINQNLMGTNLKLTESNRIKEEYIGYFFNINSEYIEKMATFQKAVHRKVVSKQYDDLINIVKNSDLKIERENMFLTFDKIFVKLFPSFVKEFNALFREEDHMLLKGDELLNPDLRIFALMRLGIKDHEKIAKFLDYSVNTIYTYKTKIKSKSIFKEHFDEKIMDIKGIN
jgi:tetratricopeptide (TPR) repeat protein